jgi:hypothetical protein
MNAPEGTAVQSLERFFDMARKVPPCDPELYMAPSTGERLESWSVDRPLVVT